MLPSCEATASGMSPGGLGDKVDAHALGADELDHLLDLFHPLAAGAVEQKVRFVKEKHDPGLVHIPHFGQDLEQLGQQVEHKGGIQPRLVDEAAGIQHVDGPLAGRVGREEIRHVDRGLAEELVRAFALQRDDGAHDGRHRLFGNAAVLALQRSGVFAGELQDGLEVLCVAQKQVFVVRQLVHDRKDVRLRLVQPKDARQQLRPDLRDGGAQRDAPLAVDVKILGGEPLVGKAVFGQGEALCAVLHVGAVLPGLGHAGKVALDVRQEHRHAHGRKALGQNLQRDRFAGACRAADKPVPVGHAGVKKHLFG